MLILVYLLSSPIFSSAAYLLSVVGLLFFLCVVQSLNAINATPKPQKQSVIYENGLPTSKAVFVLTRLKRGGIEIAKIAVSLILGVIIGYAIGSKDFNQRANVHVEHKASFRTGPPNPEWVDAQEKEK